MRIVTKDQWKIVKITGVTLGAGIYLLLWIFPVFSFYRFDRLRTAQYNPAGRQLIEVEKGFFLLPGPKTLWAVRTGMGFEVFRSFDSAVSLKSGPYGIVGADEIQKNSGFSIIDQIHSRSPKYLSKDGYTPLIRAVLNRDKTKVLALIKDGEDINAMDIKEIWTPLSIAVLNKDMDMTTLLLENGADPNRVNRDGLAVLTHLARQGGPVAMAELLVKHGADVNLRGRIGQKALNSPPLEYAIWHERGDMARFLIDKGADIHYESNDRKSYLFRNKIPELVQYLLEKGLDPNEKDKTGSTPLFYADDDEVARLLISHGADVNVCNGRGDTPIFYIRGKDACELLLKHGANLRAKNKYGESCLFRVSDPELLDFFIRKGLSVEDRNKDGKTPLHIIAGELANPDMEPMIKLMLAHGADINARDLSGKTPLDYAFDKKMVALLKKYGAK